MISDGIMILVIFALLLFIPVTVVLTVLTVSKKKRKRKLETYKGVTQGRVVKIAAKGIDHPWVIHAEYQVDGILYEIKETAKMKSTVIKAAGIPIGQRKTFVLGKIQEGDLLEIRYEKEHPEKAIIYGNDGVITG